MLQLHSEKATPKYTPWNPRFPGICRHARAIGVRRETLWKYLTGVWPMPAGTRARYEAAIKQEAAR